MTLATLTLQGAAIRPALSPIAFNFAHHFIIDTCTRVKAPPLNDTQRRLMIDCRASLESICADLPPIDEPCWPTHFRRADMIVIKPGRIITPIPGFSMREGREEKPRRGAKPYPYFSDSHCSKAAGQWRDAFLLTQFGITPRVPS